MQELNGQSYISLPQQNFTSDGTGKGVVAFTNRTPNIFGTSTTPFPRDEVPGSQSGGMEKIGVFNNADKTIFQAGSNSGQTVLAEEPSIPISIEIREKRLEVTGPQNPLNNKNVDMSRFKEVYQRAGVPLNEKTFPDDFLNQATFLKSEELAHGGNNKVWKLSFDLGNEGLRNFVFKPCKQGFGTSAGTIASGMIDYKTDAEGAPVFDDQDNPIYCINEASKPFGEGCRNIATYVLAKMLDCERIVTKTKFWIDKNNTLGILMDLEAGTTVNTGTVWRHDISHTETGKELLKSRVSLLPGNDVGGTLRKAQCQLSGLQEIKFLKSSKEDGDNDEWHVSANYANTLKISKEALLLNSSIKEQASDAEILDIISRQADRHSANYMVDMANDRLKLIDNDISFGPNSRLEMRKRMNKGQVGCIVPDFPPFISSKMSNAINNLNVQAFKEQLGGLISDTEIDQTIAAWLDVKAHYAENPRFVLKSDSEWMPIPLSGYLKRDATRLKNI